MENTIVVLFVLLALVAGIISGAVLTPNENPVEIQYQDKIVETFVEVPVEIVVDAPNQLELAVAEFMLAVEDEEDEAGHDISILDDMNYNFDEVSVYEVSDDYKVAVTNDGDTTKIDFSIRLKFEDSHDSEKKTYDVRITFEDDEDTIIKLL